MMFQKLPGLALDGTIYWNEHLGLAEGIIPPGDFKTAHAPALLELPNGDLLCSWFAGSFEGNTDISIVCARLPKGENRWGIPIQVSCDKERSEQNPSLFLHPSGEVWLVYTAQLARVTGKDNMQYTSVIRYQKSKDGGRTWGEAEVLFNTEGSFCRQPIQILSNGRWIFSNWRCTDSKEGLAGDPTLFKISDDEGNTWKEVRMPGSNGRVHANIIEMEEGYLIAFMRSRAADFIYRSESRDWGENWSVPVPTVLPNNNSSISVIKLTSDRIAIAYNPTCTPNPKSDEAVWPGLRAPIAVALSEDGGMTWPLVRHMELGEGFVGEENSTNNSQYEYPCLIQGKDGILHLVYAYRNRIGIKYIRFTEMDVLGKRRERVGVYNPTSTQGC